MVTAERAKQAQYITTLEGVSHASKGDFIVTGIDNEQWVVKPKFFHQAYTHIRDNTYQRKPQILDAVQIQDTEVVSAPTGPIRGDKGDYKVTGKQGEQWFVKPDIFEKTYERVSKMQDKNNLQKAIDQVGLEAVVRYLPKGMSLHNCTMHGKYLAHYTTPADKLTCPLCNFPTQDGNGTTATEVEHYIDIRDAVAPPHNPHS